MSCDLQDITKKEKGSLSQDDSGDEDPSVPTVCEYDVGPFYTHIHTHTHTHTHTFKLVSFPPKEKEKKSVAMT